MASATPAGGAGAPSASEEPTVENEQLSLYRGVWAEKSVRNIVFDIITHITQMTREDISPDELRFYGKGGNAVELLLKYPELPSIFPSDFDFAIDINPSLSIKEYNRIQTLYIELVINYMLRKIKEYCGTKSPLQPCIAVKTYEEIYITPVNRQLETYIDSLPSNKTKMCPVECPYRIHIIKNILFNNQMLNRGVIALQRRVGDNFIDLINISFVLHTKQSESDMHYYWNQTGFVVYDFPHTSKNNRLFIKVYDPISAYINMRIAAKGDTRSAKRRRRTERANKLRNELINPNWRTRILKKTRRNALPNNKKSMLNNIKNVTNNELPSLPGNRDGQIGLFR
jgi:hypothetical protein